MVLDGTTQANYEFAGVFGPAFILRQANCAIKGFVIANYDEQGIRITSDSASGSVGTGNAVSGCYIGTNAAGTTGLGNGMPITIRALRFWAARITTPSAA